MRRIAGEVGRQGAAQLPEVLQRAMQQQRVARVFVAGGGERVAEFAERVLLERQPRFQFDQALLQLFGASSGIAAWPSHATVAIERPRPMP